MNVVFVMGLVEGALLYQAVKSFASSDPAMCVWLALLSAGQAYAMWKVSP